MSDHPKAIVEAASLASSIYARPADAAALLIDAAAMLACEAKMPVEELIQRMEKSYDELAYAERIAATMGGNFKPQ